MHRLPAWRLLGAALVAALLAAQAVAYAHEIDPDSYAESHYCQICVSAAVLGGANVSSHCLFSLPAREHAFVICSTPLRAAPRAAHHHARAPPFLS